jgi:uncharacterized sporulation protein YeaH/YhbH (DUF444 family)
METFIIDILFDETYNSYIAEFSDGSNVVLDSSNYHDAVLEADMLDVEPVYN